ncbi:MAG TPA: hypothetical protein VG759_11120 [Candidatus Angelobacter sp.]|jgi:hypothetical protein|nr:hypothetical protein [Candidatus Angelobacter sp.]
MQHDVERLLARLYADSHIRERFLMDPEKICAQHGLSPDECRAMAMMLAQDLQTASRSFERKRNLKLHHSGFNSVWRWVKALGNWVSW